VDDIPPAADLCRRLSQEYEAALARGPGLSFKARMPVAKAG
jgi:hypothetical protein